MNTCRFTIEHHPETDQCGEDMITHAVHVEPINVNAPDWVIQKATRHMCSDKRHTSHFLPDIDLSIKLMGRRDLYALVILAPDYWDIEDAFHSDGYSQIGHHLTQAPELHRRDLETDSVVIDLEADTVTVTTRKQAWEAS